MVKRSAFDSNGGRGRTAELNGSEEPLLGLEEAPSLAVDGFQGAVITNGVVKINFFTVRNDPRSGSVPEGRMRDVHLVGLACGHAGRLRYAPQPVRARRPWRAIGPGAPQVEFLSRRRAGRHAATIR
jgi:hypothetical protein